MAKKLTLLTTKDIVFLSIFATIFGVGFILGFLGFIADFLNVTSQDNWIKNADGAVQEFLSINLSFLEWGVDLFSDRCILTRLDIKRHRTT